MNKIKLESNMKQYLIKGAKIINENTIKQQDLLIRGGYISKIGNDINPDSNYEEINAEGQYLLPGSALPPSILL